MNQALPPRRILLIDSDSGDRALTKQALMQALPQLQMGEIEEIVDAVGLTQALAESHVDLVITEAGLPGIGGLDLLQQIKTCNPNCPVIMYTQCDDLDWAIAAMKAGLEDYVVKRPANLSRLWQAIGETWNRLSHPSAQPLSTEAPHAIASDAIDLHPSEARLRESEAQFQEIAKTVSQLFFIQSVTTRQFLYVNPAYEAIWGRSCESLYQNPDSWLESVHPSDRLNVFNSLSQQFNSHPVTREYRILRPDGEIRWIFAQVKPVHDDTGTLVRLVGFATDITHRKQLEHALQASEAKLNDIINSSITAIARIRAHSDSTWRYEFCSKGHEQVFGYTTEELMADKTLWSSQVLPEDLETVVLPTFKEIFSAQDTAYEYRFRHKDGRLRWIAATLTSHRDESEDAWIVTIVSIDISKRKLAEDALRNSERQLSTLISNLPGYVYRVANDRNYTPEFVSEGVTSVSGYQPKDYLVDRTITCGQEIHPADRDAVWDAVQRAIERQQPYECEYRILTKAGIEKWVWERGRGVFSETGELLCLEGFVTDITERKTAEASLQRLNQELEQRVQDQTNQLRLALSAAQMGTWEWDLTTNTETWSPGAYHILGFKTDPSGRVLDDRGVELSPYPTHELFRQQLHPDDRAILPEILQYTLQQHLPYEAEFRVIHSDGSIHWCYSRGSYALNEHGEAVKLIGICIDISDRKQAEELLRQQARQERLLRSITQEIRQSLNLTAILKTAVAEVRKTLQTDRVAVYRFNSDWSGSFIAESVGKGWKKLVGSNVHRVWEDTYLQETQGGRYRNHETFAVADIYTVGHRDCHIALLEQFQARAYAIAPVFSGDRLWGLLAIYENASPRRWHDWEVELLQQIGNQLAIAIQQSVLYEQLQTELQERRQIEEQLRASLKEKEVLLREVYHRVKNNMQLVSSLLRLQADSIADPTVLKLLTESQRRVKTMALIHERLYRSNNLARINFATYIQALVNDLVWSYTSTDSLICMTLKVADLELDLDTAVPCALLINELISNALKYAFPDQKGEITLHFWLTDTSDYCLIVQDNGVGLPTDINPQQTDSLGMQLIYGLTEQLGGVVEINAKSGTEFKIMFKKRV